MLRLTVRSCRSASMGFSQVSLSAIRTHIMQIRKRHLALQPCPTANRAENNRLSSFAPANSNPYLHQNKVPTKNAPERAAVDGQRDAGGRDRLRSLACRLSG